MTEFTTRVITEQPDRAFLQIDDRFEVVIVRNDDGIELRIYPITLGHLWDFPFQTFTVIEDEIAVLEGAMGDLAR